jgi:RND family efflux transporter MFP subunit
VSPKATAEDLAAKSRSLTEGVRAAEADAAAADAQVAALDVNLADMTVTSPIDGTVVEKHADPGELVGPQTGTTIFDIVDFASLIVEVDVPESKLRLLKVGTPGEIVLDAFPDRRYRGAALEIGRKVDRAKATVKVKVKFVDPPEGALPDMAARVNFLQKELEAAQMKEPPKQVVAASAVLDRADGAKIVYVVDQDRVHLEVVELGDKLGDAFVLKKGPIPGTKVVSNPSADLRDGQSIKEKMN